MVDKLLRSKKRKGLLTNLLLITMVIVLVIVPLVIAKDAEFGGADDNAKEAITEINSSYEPWFLLIWEPPSTEVASFLFALQAAIGSGILFYCIGYMKGRSKRDDNEL